MSESSAPTESTQTTDTTSADQKVGHKTLDKVTSYPIVSNLVESAKSYYTAAKNYSPLVKSGLETVESNVETTIKWIEPKLESEAIKPYIEQIDQFGVRQLERMEKIPEVIQTSKESIGASVGQIASTTVTTVEQKIVIPLDSYLKDSVLAKPLETALNATENIVDRFLGEKKEGTDQESDTTNTTTGPVIRAGKITKRIKDETLQKIKSMSGSAQQNVKVQHAMELIQYATTNLEATKKTTKEWIDRGSEVLSEKKTEIQEMRDNLQKKTADALAAIVVSAKQLAKQGQDFQKKTFDVVEQKLASFSIPIESLKDMSAVSNVVNKSIEKLHEVKNMLATQGPAVSSQVLSSASSTLQSIMDNLFALSGRSSTTTSTTTTSTTTTSTQ